MRNMRSYPQNKCPKETPRTTIGPFYFVEKSKSHSADLHGDLVDATERDELVCDTEDQYLFIENPGFEQTQQPPIFSCGIGPHDTFYQLNTSRAEDAFDEISFGFRASLVHFLNFGRQSYLDEANVLVHRGVGGSQSDRNEEHTHEPGRKEQRPRAVPLCLASYPNAVRTAPPGQK